MHDFDCNLITNEVQIDLDVHGAFMLHRFHREINNIYIITIDKVARRRGEWTSC
jgi:hypothetical protein